MSDELEEKACAICGKKMRLAALKDYEGASCCSPCIDRNELKIISQE